MFGGIFSIMSKILIIIYLVFEVNKLVEKDNELITALVVKNVIQNPNDLQMTYENF